MPAREEFLHLSPESFEISIHRQVFWLVLFRRSSHSLKRTVTSVADTLMDFTATGIAPDLHGIPF